MSSKNVTCTSEISSETHLLPDSSEDGKCQPNVLSGLDTIRMAGSHSLSSSVVDIYELPVSSTGVVPSAEPCQSHFSADSSDLTNVATQRVVECAGCVAARRVVYHSCGLTSHEPLPYYEYPASLELQVTNFNRASLPGEESSKGTVTYSVQSPVSVTQVQHLEHGPHPIAFTSQPLGIGWSHHCDCSHCTKALHRRSDADLHPSFCGGRVPPGGVRQSAFGVDFLQPCLVRGAETCVTSFNPTFDIPVTHTYSTIHGHPYLPRYCVQTPQLQHSHPVPGHFQGLPFVPAHAGHHHCCSAAFQHERHEGRYHFDAPVPVIFDDRFPTAVSAGNVEPSHRLHKHEDSESIASHSVALTDVEDIHNVTCEDEEPCSETVTKIPEHSHDKQQFTEQSVQMESYQIRPPEVFFVSSDVNVNSTMDDDTSPTPDPATSRNTDAESLSFQDGAGGSCVGANRLQLASRSRSNFSAIERSLTPPERDTNCSVNSGVLKAEGADALAQEAPSARGMAFIIDFGHNQDNLEILEHRKPFRTRAGIQQRASKSKSQLKEKSESMEVDQPQQKGTRVANVASEDGCMMTRRHSAGGRSIGGYISDGQASGVSSGNEDTSICSEVMGCIQGRRKLNRSSDPRSFVDRPIPSRSKPLPVKIKPSLKQVQPRTSGVGGCEIRSAKGLSSGTSSSNKTGSMSRRTVDTKPNVTKVVSSKSDPPKRIAKSAKTSSEVTSSVRRLPKKPCDGVGVKDEILVANYLINRMLFSDKASDGFKTESRPLEGVGAVSTRSSKSKPDSARRRSGANIPDDVSETGTYTIDDDGPSGEVQKARDDIDALFGVDDPTQEQLIQPVVESAEDVSSVRNPASRELTGGAVVGEEDVFVYEPDVGVIGDCKLEVSEAVSSAISASKAIQKALRQKPSKVVDSSDCADLASKSSRPSNVSKSLSSDIQSSDVQHSEATEPSSEGERQLDVEACDEKDFGTFTVSFDAPSLLVSESRSSAPDEAPCETDDTSVQDVFVLNESRGARDVELLMQNVDAAVKKLHDVVVCKKGKGSKPFGGTEVPSVQKPSRETTFVKEVPVKAALTQRGAVQETSVRPSGSSFARWRRDRAASDAGSESETASLSSVDYSTKSSQFSRASLLSSSGGKTSFIAPRVNRTFALRCTKATDKQSDSVSLVPRSRSAGGTDGKLTLHDAGPRQASRSVSRSKSRPRNLSAASDISQSHLRPVQQNSGRGREMDQRPSEDSSTGMCSSILSRSNANFVRRDGGRYSMRTERSLGRAQSMSDCTKSRSTSKTRPAGGRTSSSARDHPDSVKAPDENSQSSAQTKELNAWKRRKQYDPRKAVANAKASGAESGVSELKNHKSSADEHGLTKKGFASQIRRQNVPSARADEIAKLSNAVAYNLNVLAESTQKDSVTLGDLPLRQLPIICCGSGSAFTALRAATSRKSQSVAVGSFDRTASLEDSKKSSYDSFLVNSIQQVSHKVQVLTDQLITKVRDEKQRGASGDVPLSYPQRDGSLPAWEHASPELSSILENLKRTEQHLRVVHKTLFTGGNKRDALEPQLQTAERQRTVAEREGFRPIERPLSRNRSRKQSPTRQQASLSTNPLSGDEYY